MGVSDLPTCRPGDVFCQLMRIAARRGVYSAYAQKNLIQAQYFRDPNRLSAYYETNDFLTRVNGEVREKRDKGFKKNLASLNELVLIMFSRDTTVVPRESSWFGSFAPPADDEHWGEPGEPMPMRMQPLYKHDWIGLKAVSVIISLLDQNLIIIEHASPFVARPSGARNSPILRWRAHANNSGVLGAIGG